MKGPMLFTALVVIIILFYLSEIMEFYGSWYQQNKFFADDIA